MYSSNKIKMEFHLSRKARDFYNFDKSLFSSSGNIIFADFHASRVFAHKMNQKKDLALYPEKAIKAGQINAMGLIDEILHLVMEIYREQDSPELMKELIQYLNSNIGEENVEKTIRKFADEFPPIAVYLHEISLDEYLKGNTDGYSNRQILLEEMIMLWLENVNPAFKPFIELFDDSTLKRETSYIKIAGLFHNFFNAKPFFGPDNQNLIDMLRSPAIVVPYSLPGQIEYIREKWGFLLKNRMKFFNRLLSSQDLISEEEKAIFGVGGQGPSKVYEFAGLAIEKEKFSPDKDWMPRLVLIAKNIYVWLFQLSKKYNKELKILSDIPDEELDYLKEWGITGLWLIGLWERSKASQEIKRRRGNPEAVASAYSLYDYRIADDLGGDNAYNNLNERARARGIRLSSDMVPNHMGIDSKWVIEHPDWFINLDYPPYPAYTFHGHNFSNEGRVGIFIEDHYFDNTDAAVVFKRIDFHTGSAKYIYHGNDGTSMPWNDTAQLNFLNPEVRENVIQTILHVARKFSIIRFDAAMTLAKKHYQRLWFPEPGTGGAIPSRSEFGLTKEEFDDKIPEEFWREVVDRVANEVPDTLLLAEAFWLMEGYFVRTLGMHRVYNSAFMNMLRDEKNAEYRMVMKNTLEFDPEILKRYVNFMNNPDEYTAVEQFGKGDKYFGICTLMATMPGLPMIGHGQIEGFTEKYGMEYRRAYYDEYPDNWLTERHKREIFPLFRHRKLFAEVKDFLLYDFFSTDGYVNENIFVYSNKDGLECSLVIYQNAYATARGWIKNSAAFALKHENGTKTVTRKTLCEGLGIENNSRKFTVFREHNTGMEFIRSNSELCEKGLYIEMEAYKYHVFVDFHQEADNELHQYRMLNEFLKGKGVPSIQEAMKEMFLQPIHYAYREIINPGFIKHVIDQRAKSKLVIESNLKDIFTEINTKSGLLLKEIKKHSHVTSDEKIIINENCENLFNALNLTCLDLINPSDMEYQKAVKFLLDPEEYVSLEELSDGFLKGDEQIWSPLLCWLFSYNIGKILESNDFIEVSLSWLDEWMINKLLANFFKNLGMDEDTAWYKTGLVKILIEHSQWWNINQDNIKDNQFHNPNSAYEILLSWLRDNKMHQFIGSNRYQDVLWFNKELFEIWLWWMYAIAVIRINSNDNLKIPEKNNEIINCYNVIDTFLQALENSEFQTAKLLQATKKIELEKELLDKI